MDIDIKQNLHNLFNILIPVDTQIEVISEVNKTKIIDEIKKLDIAQQEFINTYIDKFKKIDDELKIVLTNVLSSEMSTANTYLDKIFRLQRNILLTYIKKNVSSNCSEPINKLLMSSNDKIDSINKVLEEHYKNTENVTQSQTAAPAPAQPPITLSENTYESLDSSKISNPENAAEQINEIIGKKLKKTDYLNNKYFKMIGGTHQTELVSSVFILSKLYNILKSDIFIYTITLMSNKTKFDLILLKISDDEKSLNYVKSFFIDLSSYDLVVSEIKKHYNLIDDQIKRDTIIYKTYDLITTSNYIFGYTILSNIIKIIKKNKDNISIFLSPIKMIIQFYNLLSLLVNNIINIKDKIYTAFYNQYNNFKVNYIEYIEELNIVTTFVKVRNDNVGGGSNERYKIKSVNQAPNKYLLIEYKNFDGDYSKANLSKVKKEIYYYGPFNNVFDNPRISNKDVAKECDIILKKLLTGLIVCLIGYGQSGSGKTSTIIQLNIKNSNGTIISNPGVLVELCNMTDFKNKFVTINIKYINVYINHHFGLDPNVSIDEQDKYFIETPIGADSTFTYVSDGWKDTNGKFLGDSILHAFDARQIEPSPNNPDSSRSHVIVFMELLDASEKSSYLIICDFAGVENKFLCDKLKELIKFDNQYKNSGKYGKTITDPTTYESTKYANITYDKYRCGLPTEQKDKYKTNEKKTFDITERICTPEYIAQEKEEYENQTLDNGTLLFTEGRENNTIAEYYQFLDLKISEVKSNKDIISYLLLEDTLKMNPDNFISTHAIGKTAAVYDEDTVIRMYKEFSKKNGISEDITTFVKASDETGLMSLYYNGKAKARAKQKKPFKGNSIGISFGSSPFKTYNDDIAKLPKTSDKIIEVFKNLNKEYQSQKDTNGNSIFIELYALEKVNYAKITKYINEKKRLETIMYNCGIRVNEGYLINRTLRDLKTNINTLIKSVYLMKSENNIAPLFADNDIFPYCRIINLNNDMFEQFYDVKPYNSLNDNFFFKIFTRLKVDMTKLNFVVFTVINITPSANNPPNPPYINLNDLMYTYYNIDEYVKEGVTKEDILFKKLKEINDNLKNYDFYKELEDFKTIRTVSGNDNIPNMTDIQINIETILNVIKNNNELTLIGTLETTDFYKHSVYTKYVCSFYDNLTMKEHYKTELRHVIEAAKSTQDIISYNTEITTEITI